MAEIDKKKIITAGLIGGTIFVIVITLFDYFLGKEFSLPKLGLYFVFGVLMYGYLTYRKFKKHNKK